MEVDPEQRPERISVRGMGGWAVTKINNRPFRATNMPLPPPPNQTPRPISRENTLQTSGRGFCGKRGAHDGAISIYSLEYINWCDSCAICHIPALNKLPWNILASLNSGNASSRSKFRSWKSHNVCKCPCICHFWVHLLLVFFLSISVHSVAVTGILSFTFHFVATVSAKFCNVIKVLML